MDKQLYAVGIMIRTFETNTGARIKASSYDEGCVGFLPVYGTRSEAEKAYPGNGLIELGSDAIKESEE